MNEINKLVPILYSVYFSVSMVSIYGFDKLIAADLLSDREPKMSLHLHAW